MGLQRVRHNWTASTFTFLQPLTLWREGQSCIIICIHMTVCCCARWGLCQECVSGFSTHLSFFFFFLILQFCRNCSSASFRIFFRNCAVYGCRLCAWEEAFWHFKLFFVICLFPISLTSLDYFLSFSFVFLFIGKNFKS